MMDVSLLRNPVFLLICISNVFGMAGLYIPFFYLVDAAVKNVSTFLSIQYDDPDYYGIAFKRRAYLILLL